MATLAEYHNKVFTRHAVDMLINKARPIRDVLQRFNKKDSAMVEEPNERDLATLMKFIEHNTLQTLSKLLFVASGAKYSIATNIMTLETLLTHPAEFAKKHRESPEEQAFKQNLSREPMVAYIASQTLTHNEIIPEDEQGANIWDILTQRAPIRETRQSAPFWDVPEQPGEDSDEGHHDYGYDDEGEEDDKDAFNTLESSAERVIHQATRPQAVPRTGNPIAGPERKDASFTKEGHVEHQHLGQLRPHYWSRKHIGNQCAPGCKEDTNRSLWSRHPRNNSQNITWTRRMCPAPGFQRFHTLENYLFWPSRQTRLMLSGEAFVADQENMQGVVLVCKNQLNIDTLREIKISFT